MVVVEIAVVLSVVVVVVVVVVSGTESQHVTVHFAPEQLALEHWAQLQ